MLLQPGKGQLPEASTGRSEAFSPPLTAPRALHGSRTGLV